MGLLSFSLTGVDFDVSLVFLTEGSKCLQFRYGISAASRMARWPIQIRCYVASFFIIAKAVQNIVSA